MPNTSIVAHTQVEKNGTEIDSQLRDITDRLEGLDEVRARGHSFSH